MKIAVVVDWLVTYAGAERLLEKILICFPDADLFAVVDFIPEGQRDWLQNKKAITTFIQKLPFAKTKYRSYLPLMPLAIEQLDMSGYDVIISSSHAVAKGVITGPDQLHLCYIHTPIRYAWDLQHQYLKAAKLDKGIKGLWAKWFLHKMRIWDLRTVPSVDYFFCNSAYIARRVHKCYRRSAEVIYSGPSLNDFEVTVEKENFYLTASRMVPYKKMDLIVEAFKQMPDKKLIVIGDGPDFVKIKKIKAPNVILLGYQPFEVLKDHLQRAKAFVFAAEEDFGLLPVEAQACGTPVIAFEKGGAVETVVGLGNSNPTGVFFKEQAPDSIINAVKIFESHPGGFDAYACRKNSERFSLEEFCQIFPQKVRVLWQAWQDEKKVSHAS